jgi:hypothetical protein
MERYDIRPATGRLCVIYITEIRLAGGTEHEHIVGVKWHNPRSGKSGQSSREAMVTWIRDPKHDARVIEGVNEIDVDIVNASPPYFRTQADGEWTDNLLALPQF